jgi:zinc protease
MSRAAIVVVLSSLASLAAASGKPDLSQPPALPPPPPWSAPVPESAATTAGTQVVVLPSRQLPLVHLLAIVSAGSALDPPDHHGLAAATAMMLQDGGAGERSAPAFAQAVEDLGGELEVRLDGDEVQLSLSVLARNLGPALALLGDVLARPRFDAAEWPRAQARRIDEIRHRRDEPRFVADDEMERALYGDHPYGHPVWGTPESVAAIGIDDVRRFYAAHYGPRTVAFVLVGDTDVAAAVPSVARALAEWKSTATPPSVPPPVPPAPPRLVLIDRPGAPQSELRVGHLGRDRKTADFAAIQVLQTVLGGSFTSRLNQNLREKHGYTYGARAQFELRRATGPFVEQAAVRTDVTVPSLREMLAETAAIKKPLTADEAAKGRSLVLSSVVEAFGDGNQTTGFLADLISHGLPLDSWSKVPGELARLDPLQLAQVANKLFQPERLTVVVVGDKKSIEADLVRSVPWLKIIEQRDVDGRLVKATAATK